MNAISISGLTIIRSGKKLFDSFCFEVEEGSTTCLIAPSGSGKTTLLSWIAGITPENCETLEGNITLSHRNVSMLFQEPRLFPDVSVLENVAMPLYNLMQKKDALSRASDFLNRVNLLQKADAMANCLSGGEMQRTAFARAFAFPSEILLMDEPFQSQDFMLKTKLIENVKTLLETEKRTVLFVTHDVNEAESLASRIVVLDGEPLSVHYDVENVPKTAY